MNQFRKVMEKSLSGQLFHAWKHALPETLHRNRRALSALGIASVVMATSACSGNDSPTVDASSTAPSSAPSISLTATPSAVPSAPSVTPGSLLKGIPTKHEVANDGKGEYVQTTIAPNDPALEYNPLITDSSASAYSPEDLAAAQKIAVNFLAEEGIDSTLNNNSSDPATQEAWWEKNKDWFDPYYQSEIYSIIKDNDPNKPVVFRGQFRQDKYNLSTGPRATHVYSRTITPVLMKAGMRNGHNLVAFEAKVSFVLNADDNGTPVKESTNGEVSYTMSKASSGNWLITGFNANYTTIPVK